MNTSARSALIAAAYGLSSQSWKWRRSCAWADATARFPAACSGSWPMSDRPKRSLSAGCRGELITGSVGQQPDVIRKGILPDPPELPGPPSNSSAGKNAQNHQSHVVVLRSPGSEGMGRGHDSGDGLSGREARAGLRSSDQVLFPPLLVL